MKLTFKDLKQQKFVIEAEPSETILEVKEKISQEKGWDAAQQKLIYSGKILQDANTVESYKVEEKGFIVCMVTKPKAAPTPATPATLAAKTPTTPAPVPAQTPAAPAQSDATTESTTRDVPATPTPQAGATEGTGDASGLLVGAEREAAIAQIESMGMGFGRAEINRAMQAAFNNPDRAVEYLYSGIPENLQQPQAPRGVAAPAEPPTASPPATEENTGEQPVNLFEAAAQAGQGGRTGGTGSARARARAAVAEAAEGGDLGTTDLNFLRNNPQFQQLRQVVQQQPGMLEPILQTVGQGNPQLAALIGQNPDQFLQLLSEENDEDAPLPPGAQAISVTEEERDAIDRLTRLGFPRDEVIQAYFACDKNEELAANFLFDQPPEDDPPQ